LLKSQICQGARGGTLKEPGHFWEFREKKDFGEKQMRIKRVEEKNKGGL